MGTAGATLTRTRDPAAILAALQQRVAIDQPVILVVAHPDDETIGAGPLLHLFRNLRLLVVTDGAPRNLHDARAAGFADGAAYAAARRRELAAALDAGGAMPTLVSGPGLPIADQAASSCLAWLAQRLRTVMEDACLVLTHAWEGGHPDHDAVAFAVQASGLPTIEMAGYHAGPDGSLEVGRFLDGPSETIVDLDAAEQARRDAMLGCFGTQRATLAPFFGATELRFRPAPRYDFARPPWSCAYYDRFDWGMDSRRWQALAREALAC